MNKSEMVLVPRALLGAVASALETGNPAAKTLESVREFYLVDGSEEQPSAAEVTLRAIASQIGLDLSGPLPEGELSTVIINAIRGGADDFPDVKTLQEAGKCTTSADWALADNGIDLEAADFSDALMWLKEGKRVCRSGWNGRGQWAELVKNSGLVFRSELTEEVYSVADGLILKNAQGIVVQWVPSIGDLMATDWQVYEGQSVFVNKTAQVPLSSELAKLEADIPPHQLRVLEELAQLTDRLDKLTAFFDTDVYRSLDVDERGRLKEQCALMGELQRVLAERVAAF